jgi:hypothetical protein
MAAGQLQEGCLSRCCCSGYGGSSHQLQALRHLLVLQLLRLLLLSTFPLFLLLLLLMAVLTEWIFRLLYS